MQQGRILALDYGKSTLGLAVTDEQRIMVFGRGALDLKKGNLPVFHQIKDLCEKERVVALVIGLPLNIDGEDTPQTFIIKSFVQKLQQFLGNLPIYFQDESFSSFEADQLLENAGIQLRGRKQHQDELAAILILERWLKSQKGEEI